MYICINRNNINVYSTCINRGTDKHMYFRILFWRHNAAGCYGAASPPPWLLWRCLTSPLVAMALPHLSQEGKDSAVPDPCQHGLGVATPIAGDDDTAHSLDSQILSG